MQHKNMLDMYVCLYIGLEKDGKVFDVRKVSSAYF